jgi:hypothetical protein
MFIKKLKHLSKKKQENKTDIQSVDFKLKVHNCPNLNFKNHIPVQRKMESLKKDNHCFTISFDSKEHRRIEF